jgi:multidrug efflux pump subunit AcrB
LLIERFAELKQDGKLSIDERLLRTVKSRVKPVFLTTLTTIL